MYSEINAAVGFLSSFLFDKLPRRKVNLFSQQLANFLLIRYEKTWNPSEPHKGTEIRRMQIKCQGGVTDSLISVTASNVGMEMDELLQHWPDDLTVWVDPGEVTYRVGERGAAMIIYSASEANNSFLNRLLSQGAGMSTHNNSNNNNNALRLNLPGGQPDTAAHSPLPLLHHPLVEKTPPSHMVVNNPVTPSFELSTPNDIQFTVGSFAMTRFGTTKVKNTPAALNRLRQKHRSRPSDTQQFRQQSNDTQFRPIFSQSMLSPSLSLGQENISGGRSNNQATFCAAPGSCRPSPSSAFNPFGNSEGNSPQSSSREMDSSDPTSSPLSNEITSPLFGLPPIRPNVWGNF